MNYKNKITLPGSSKKAQGDPSVKKGSYYTLFDPSKRNTEHPEPCFIGAELLKGKTDIKVWDPHICFNILKDKDYLFFKYIDQENVNVEILTSYHGALNPCKEEVEMLYSKIVEILEENIQDFTLSIYVVCYDNENNAFRQGKLWHDRFLILDNDDVYLMGTSISGQMSAKRLFGIHKQTEREDRDIVINAYHDYLKKARKIIIE